MPKHFWRIVNMSKIAASYATKVLLPGKLELCQMLPVTFEPDMNTTLNYKYGVFPGVKPVEPTKIRYFGYGIRGRYIVNDDALTAAYKPLADEMNLYQQIPFRLVPADEDISAAEKTKYRMRVKTTIGGVSYIAYYLKMIDIEDKVRYTRIDPKTNEEIPYELDPSKLNPIPVKLNDSGTTDATIQEIKASVKGKVTITGKEVVEAINVLFKGDLRYAVVSEFGFYTGEEKLVDDVTSTGVNFSYTESIYTQLAIKSTFNGIDLSQIGSSQDVNILFTSGSPFIQLR